MMTAIGTCFLSFFICAYSTNDLNSKFIEPLAAIRPTPPAAACSKQFDLFNRKCPVDKYDTVILSE